MPTLAELYASHPFWVWLAAAAALLAAEIATGTGWLLWPAVSAAVVGAVMAVRPLPAPEALAAFAGLTIVSTVLARRYFPRRFAAHGHDINDNLARVVGHRGRAVADFKGGAGRVFVDGKEWAAELTSDAALAAGQAVEVVAVHGVQLQVRPV